MRNSNLEDERKLHEHGEFDTNVMFTDLFGNRCHIKKVKKNNGLGSGLTNRRVIVESAETNEVYVLLNESLFAINRGNTQPSQKKPRIKPHVKGTRPERLVPYDSKLMDKPRWVKLRDGARCYAEACGELLSLDGTLSLWLQSGKRSKVEDTLSDSDIVGVYLRFEEWNNQPKKYKINNPASGWISGNDVPKDGNYYFVQWAIFPMVFILKFYNGHYEINGVKYLNLKGFVSAYKPVEHEGLYKYGC